MLIKLIFLSKIGRETNYSNLYELSFQINTVSFLMWKNRENQDLSLHAKRFKQGSICMVPFFSLFNKMWSEIEPRASCSQGKWLSQGHQRGIQAVIKVDIYHGVSACPLCGVVPALRPVDGVTILSKTNCQVLLQRYMGRMYETIF